MNRGIDRPVPDPGARRVLAEEVVARESVRRRIDRPPADTRYLPASPGLGQRLGFAVDEVVHHHDVSSGCIRAATPAGDPHDEDTLTGIEPHPQEREAAAIRGPRQDIPAEEQSTRDIEIFNLRAVLVIDSGEDRAESADGRARLPARHEEDGLKDVAVQGGEETLG